MGNEQLHMDKIVDRGLSILAYEHNPGLGSACIIGI